MCKIRKMGAAVGLCFNYCVGSVQAESHRLLLEKARRQVQEASDLLCADCYESAPASARGFDGETGFSRAHFRAHIYVHKAVTLEM